MATRSMSPLNRFVRDVRRAALARDPTVLPDGRLLEAFLAGRDEAAFASLVQRHGPMVLGVCLRVLGNVHDAEDAFQAVFLVLARKAGSVVPRDLVGNWLYGVAFRTALQARDRLGRHRARERQVLDMPHPTVAPDVDLRELHRVLDLELDRLPEKFRVPIVLCDLEGRSRKEVAAQLRIPEGTLSSRLAKGRALLAGRLARHGLVLPGAALAVVLGQHAAAAAVQPALVAATVKAAALAAVGESALGVVSAEAVALSQGVLKTMFLTRLKVFAVLLVGAVLGAAGAGTLGLPGAANAPAVQAAPPGQTGGQQAGPGGKNDEPLDGSLLLDEAVQTELRLSKNQVNQLQAVAGQVDEKNRPKRAAIKQLQKQIEELHKRVATLEAGIIAERTQSLGKAAPDILSSQAVTRLRQIQRQQRPLDQVLEDPKMRRLLKVDDEQWKKIETILKTEPRDSIWASDQLATHYLGLRYLASDLAARIYDTQGDGYYALRGRYLTTNMVFSSPNEKTLRKLFDVLTPGQQRTLLEWAGEPYQSSSWKALHAK
jgi:RNA polymerase sigma factor (sigma-70 family)